MTEITQAIQRLFSLHHARVLAGKRGSHLLMQETQIQVLSKHDEQLLTRFDLTKPFPFDPTRSQEYTLIRLSFWLRGYDIHEEPEQQTLRISQSPRHPRWHPERPRCEQVGYQDLSLALNQLAWWLHLVETHHCPFWDGAHLCVTREGYHSGSVPFGYPRPIYPKASDDAPSTYRP